MPSGYCWRLCNSGILLGVLVIDINIPRNQSLLAFLLIAAVVFLPAVPALGQDDHGFRFVRIQYGTENLGWSRGGDPWSHDYPRAELHFYEALERTTAIRTARPPIVLRLDDERIFEYPVLYLCEPGYWEMNDEEAANLRAYLDRGGFILFDDFRGMREWQQLERQLQRVLPEAAPVELTPDHFIWSIYYEIDPIAAPSLVSGGYSADEDRYFALFDDNGRMMALMCYNQDIGDGWEWPDRNFEDASTISFQMGINFLLYALTH